MWCVRRYTRVLPVMYPTGHRIYRIFHRSSGTVLWNLHNTTRDRCNLVACWNHTYNDNVRDLILFRLKIWHDNPLKVCTHRHIDDLEGGSISRPWPLDSLYFDTHKMKPIISFGPKNMLICIKEMHIVNRRNMLLLRYF